MSIWSFILSSLTAGHPARLDTPILFPMFPNVKSKTAMHKKKVMSSRHAVNRYETIQDFANLIFSVRSTRMNFFFQFRNYKIENPWMTP